MPVTSILPIIATAALGAAVFAPARNVRSDVAPVKAALESTDRVEDFAEHALSPSALCAAAHPAASGRETPGAGTPAQRLLAVQRLTTLGDSAAVGAALNDPLDAVAACAALACLRRATPEQYRMFLLRHVDGARCEYLLALLGGYLA